jgi:hypothetical protein
MPRATGTFDVKLSPLPAYDSTPDTKLGRLSLDKQFHGDLDATSKGEMLSARTNDQLVGLSGNPAIIIAPDGKHSYEFEYTLPESL